MNPTDDALDLTVVMPCLDEVESVASCVDDALGYIQSRALRGEVLVVDNGSRDGSAEAAAAHGARVIGEARRGYGMALRAGIAESRGRVILMGDCDTTYDFRRLDGLYRPLANNEADMVIGDRFAGGIQRGAMPLSHRLGVKWLSALGRWRYRTDVRDFHCGQRGLTREAACALDFTAAGMEFATEMIARAAAAGLRIAQTPVVLRKCASEKRRSKLRTLPDGFRHLRYIIQSNPAARAGKEGRP